MPSRRLALLFVRALGAVLWVVLARERPHSAADATRAAFGAREPLRRSPSRGVRAGAAPVLFRRA